MDLTTTQLFYGILGGMLPSCLWLWFWLKENHLHPEPRKKIAACFVFGMVAVLLALPFEALANYFYHDSIHLYIIWAFTEEILKFLAIAFVVLPKKKMDEPIDAMIYMITAALGFAALENTFFLLGTIKNGSLVTTIVTGNLRFIGATLLHTVCSSAVGFMIAVTFYLRKSVKIIAIVVGLAVAGTLHATFNLAIINSNTFDTLRAFGWVWGGVVLLAILFEEVKAVKPLKAASNK